MMFFVIYRNRKKRVRGVPAPTAVRVTVMHECQAGVNKEWTYENDYPDDVAVMVRYGDEPEPRIFFRSSLVELQEGDVLYLLRRVLSHKRPSERAEYENAATGERKMFSLSEVEKVEHKALPGFVPSFVMTAEGDMCFPDDL